MFGNLKQIMEAKAKIEKVQKELKNIRITEEAMDGKLKVVVNGIAEVIEIKISEEIFKSSDIKKIERTLTNLINTAQKKAQNESTKKMQELLKDLPPEIRRQLGI
ncbi:MAG: YbaB/EbfC family nucleoid-associated protein [candidate division WOR-3 bacterium]|nr:YbaB/EbfC family nucleoid-associated protein [candidate division WOR-3 bacterium]MCX7947260.1 YbaB/EbfC family nucleoid-associated protein [candidate division WOR-3 bacterium]MDW8150183.1 YbaB/EbfC family nucleoid-associated protein [candidate division WOR-3 bacterium]